MEKSKECLEMIVFKLEQALLLWEKQSHFDIYIWHSALISFLNHVQTNETKLFFPY